MDEVFPGISIFDCDSHWSEPADLWTSRAPASMKGRVPAVRDTGDMQAWFVGDIPLGPIGLCVVRPDGGKEYGKLFLERFEMLHEAAWNAKARVRMLDSLGIGTPIVYPNVAGFASSRFVEIDDAALREACVSIYNDAAAELQAESGGRLRPQAILPFWDPKAMLREASRVREELGLHGLTITDTPEKIGLPDYGDEYWNPFWELVSDLELPLNFHIAAGGTELFTSAPWDSHGPQCSMAVGGALLYLDNARMITNLLYSDLLERFPKLRFVSVESGLGWIPFLLEACEYQWDQMVPTECKHHELRPTEKFRRNIYACFWFEHEGPARLIECIGPDNVLFETDFPHPTCLYPHSTEHLRSVLGGLSEHVQRRVLHDNAAGLYGAAD